MQNVSKKQRRVRCLSTILCVLALCMALAGCESPETHVARAKKMSKAPDKPIAKSDQDALDLRSADIESERYLPVLERLQRRQQTITRVLERRSQAR